MRFPNLTVIALALVAAPAAAQNGVAPVALTDFADAFDKAQIAKDRAALEQMVTDDLVFIDATGKRLGKKEFIDGWTEAGDSFDPVVLTDRIVIPLGRDAGIVGAETELRGTSGGKRFASRFRFHIRKPRIISPASRSCSSLRASVIFRN